MEVSVMKSSRITRIVALGLVLLVPALSEAGSPLICFPFQTGTAEVLPWSRGEGWKTPDPRYNVQNLTADVLRLLSPDAPVLARMENMRRAAIYASQDQRVTAQLLAAIVARTNTPAPSALALFDAGYFIETLRNGSYMRMNAAPKQDGYALVSRAITVAGANAEMEFAASLMAPAGRADEHRRRARAGAATNTLLAQSMDTFGK
jgi:hypothetical protein